MSRLNSKTINAFTLFESLVTLSVVSFLTLSLGSSVREIFHQVERTLFLLEFEHVYRETQRLSVSQQKPTRLVIGPHAIENPLGRYPIPRSIIPEQNLTIVFNQTGGNSSLAKIVFKTPEGSVRYQLYLGSGQYQKKTD